MAAKKGKPYITVEGEGASAKVTEHASKKAAYDHGMALRRQGKTVFAHSAADAAKFGLDPRKSNAGSAPQKETAMATKKKPIAVVRGERAVSKERKVTLDTQKMNKQIAKSNPLFASQQRAAASKQKKERAAYVERHSTALRPDSGTAAMGNINRARNPLSDADLAKKAAAFESRKAKPAQTDLRVQEMAARSQEGAGRRSQEAKEMRDRAYARRDNTKKTGKVPAIALNTPSMDRSFGQTSNAAMLQHAKGKVASADSPKKAAAAQSSVKQFSDVAKHDRLRAGKTSGAVQRALHKGAFSAPAKSSISLKAHTGVETASGSRGLAPARKIKYHMSEARAHHSDAREYKSTGDSRLGHAQTEQASHTLAAKRAQVLQSAAKTVKGAGMKPVQHALQRGKKGGTFYISNGKKVYAKK